MKHEDKRGEWIHVNDEVNVDDPRNDVDSHQNAFTGIVINASETFVTVQDQDGDCFDIDPSCLEVVIFNDGVPFEDEYNESCECPDCGIGLLKTCMVDDNIGCGIHEETICSECGS